MPEFLEDPSVLTKEKLKSELIANNVSLPGGEQRKDVYVQLYLQHLTARNAPGAPVQPDFSSDEERETTPLAVRNRAGGGGNAAVGRKATKKTDKPRPDEKDDVDVTELSNEELKEQLMRYGVNTGPIVATTRKLYEKKLLKLKEQTQELRSLISTPAVSSSAENNKQNGNNDSDQFSDNEEDPQIELKLEKREPLKGRTKVPITLKQQRIAEHNQNYSDDGITETFWRSGASKSGLLQAFSRESATVSRRATRKRVETAVLLPVHDAVMSESTPIAETVVASSNETLQVGNRVPGNVKHADPVLSISDFSKLPRRTPKKPLTIELMEKTPTEERRLERDILKEMFPYEASTPTGIRWIHGRTKAFSMAFQSLSKKMMFVAWLRDGPQPLLDTPCNGSASLGSKKSLKHVGRAGIFCAIVSHPADSVVSVLKKGKGSSVVEVLKRLGFK